MLFYSACTAALLLSSGGVSGRYSGGSCLGKGGGRRDVYKRQVMMYDEVKAAQFAERMRAKCGYVVAFSYPVVPKGKARIRTQVCASHTKEDIDFIVKFFKEVREEMGC